MTKLKNQVSIFRRLRAETLDECSRMHKGKERILKAHLSGKAQLAGNP